MGRCDGGTSLMASITSNAETTHSVRASKQKAKCAPKQNNALPSTSRMYTNLVYASPAQHITTTNTSNRASPDNVGAAQQHCVRANFFPQLSPPSVARFLIREL